ncbi:MAG TPA: hypothetical protein P5571_12405 [Candidatus Krumholzibacteria bacterium]|mgnify:CR=1 FL=1|nr:hypothetical protein [Candidatus Krumholzibacteria bacterium]HRX52162.1 hypothetical protein [Candidatus Krumholzibacteria bacterium]
MNLVRSRLTVLATLPLFLLAAGCSERDPSDLPQARAPIDPVVYDDGQGGDSALLQGDVYFQPFSGTYIEALVPVTDQAYESAQSLQVTVPGLNSPLGAYAGGVLTAVGVRDFADFNALTFYARSSQNSTLNEVGYGNDNTGTSVYTAGRSNVPLTTDWTFVVVPIPDPSKLIAERGLFMFAEGWESSAGHKIWFDSIRFANLGNITNPRPSMPTVDKEYFVGASVSLAGTATTYDIDGADVTVNHMPGYFDYSVSDPSVAQVTDGAVHVIGVGETTVTARLGAIEATGAVTVNGKQAPAGPAPTPTHPAADVVSLFSDAYTDSPVESWNPHWQWSTTEDGLFELDGDQARMYSSLNFVGIVFQSTPVDASTMTHLHLDVYAPEGTSFLVKLVAFNGAGGAAIGNKELTFNADSTPAFTAGGWSSLEIPMADFGFTVSTAALGQLVLSSPDASLVLVDNIYWHR